LLLKYASLVQKAVKVSIEKEEEELDFVKAMEERRLPC
jgi:hypothetical protein